MKTETPAGENVFFELKRFVAFGAEDEAALRALVPTVRPHFRRIADAFYSRLLGHEDARRIFDGDEQVERLKAQLVLWLDRLFTGPWDEDYNQLRLRIGRRHVEIRLPQRFMFGAMSVIRGELSALTTRAAGSVAGASAGLTAIGKILDIELGLMLESYATAHLAEVQRSERLEAALDKERLAERTRRAESLASLGTMAAGLAHEVRNPLNAAKLQLELVQRRLARQGGPDLPGVRVAAGLVSAELNRLAQLVDEVLQFARPQPLRRMRVDFAETVRGIVAFVAPDAAARGVEIRLEACDAAAAVLDEERMKQVLLNLVRNAIEACEGNGGGRVTVAVAVDDANVRLDVADDGPGIPDDGAPIFEPFFTTKPEGTGLGLTFVQRIVSDHGGTVTCESRPGRTVFSINLPRFAGI